MKVRRDRAAGRARVEPAVHRDARGFFLETYHAAQVPRRRHRAAVRAGQPLALRRRACCAACTRSSASRRASWCACVARRDLRRRGRHPPRLAALRPLGRRRAVRGELPPALGAARLRARLLRAERAGRGRVQVHRAVEPGRRRSPCAGTIPQIGIAWPIDAPQSVGQGRRGAVAGGDLRSAAAARRRGAGRRAAADVGIDGAGPSRRQLGREHRRCWMQIPLHYTPGAPQHGSTGERSDGVSGLRGAHDAPGLFQLDLRRLRPSLRRRPAGGARRC